MQQINSLVPSKKDSYYLPGFNRFAKYNKLEFSKARLLLAQILIILAKEIRLLFTATFLFAKQTINLKHFKSDQVCLYRGLFGL